MNLFDTADVYSQGLSEQILGEAIKGKRNRVLISTKTTFPMGEGPNDFGSSRQHLVEATDASLNRLGVDHIDLLQLHGQDYNRRSKRRLRRSINSSGRARSATSAARIFPAGI